MRLGNATDLIDRFEAHVFVPKRERICRRWRIIRHQFMQFLIGIRINKFVTIHEPAESLRQAHIAQVGVDSHTREVFNQTDGLPE